MGPMMKELEDAMAENMKALDKLEEWVCLFVYMLPLIFLVSFSISSLINNMEISG